MHARTHTEKLKYTSKRSIRRKVPRQSSMRQKFTKHHFVSANYSQTWGLSVVHILCENLLDKTYFSLYKCYQLQTASRLGVGDGVQFATLRAGTHLVGACTGSLPFPFLNPNHPLIPPSNFLTCFKTT